MSSKYDKKSKEYWTRGPGRFERQAAAPSPTPQPEPTPEPEPAPVVEETQVEDSAQEEE